MVACGSSDEGSGSADRSSSTTATEVEAIEVADWEWSQVSDEAPWGGRAGLRVVDLDGTLLLMGGRTPKDSPIPGDSTIWGDVWASEDKGATWTEVVADGTEGHWPARAYFQAVRKDDAVYVLGGQDFSANSNFFNDVWRSTDGETWEQMTAEAPWAGRAGLSAAVLGEHLYVMAGSRNDDQAVIGPAGPTCEYFNDVWRSTDGAEWEQMNDAAPWEPRAGGVVLERDGLLWLFGGEAGFLCQPEPCEPPYFNDVWTSPDGAEWTQVTESAGWSPRPGHTCEAVDEEFVCFGGFGTPTNPQDVWTSTDGEDWVQVGDDPWGAQTPEEVRYDFDALVLDGEILSFGGDRETFDFGDPENYLRVDDDVYRFGPPQ